MVDLPRVDGVEIRRVPGWAHYCVGNDGSFWIYPLSGKRWIKGQAPSWKKQSPTYDLNGYPKANLWDGKKARTVLIHTLVLEAFVGPRPPGCECRHLDGSKTNNRLSNLQWGTYQENTDDKRRHGTILKGEANSTSKLSASAVNLIRRLRHSGVSCMQLAYAFELNETTIAKAASGETWAHVPTRLGCGDLCDYQDYLRVRNIAKRKQKHSKAARDAAERAQSPR